MMLLWCSSLCSSRRRVLQRSLLGGVSPLFVAALHMARQPHLAPLPLQLLLPSSTECRLLQFVPVVCGIDWQERV